MSRKIKSVRNSVVYGVAQGIGHAKVDVHVGFKPRRIEIRNGKCLCSWVVGMKNGIMDKIKADGFSVSYQGIAISADGFTLGLDADLNVADTQIVWTAYR